MQPENNDIWADILKIIDKGFNEEGLTKLEYYAEGFNEGKILYKRFSPQEQHGCRTGGINHVIASLLAGAKVAAGKSPEGSFSSFKEECKQAQEQIKTIKSWSQNYGIWFENIDQTLNSSLGLYFAQGGEADVYDNGASVVKTIGLDYFIQPIYALDRITLHNTWFPETRLKVIGFGENQNGDFKIIVEQPYIQGLPVSQDDINEFLVSMGFKLKDLRSWTFYTPEIYLSDMHDENVLRSSTGTYFVIDCDIRLNSPHLNANGIRHLTTEIEIHP